MRILLNFSFSLESCVVLYSMEERLVLQLKSNSPLIDVNLLFLPKGASLAQDVSLCSPTGRSVGSMQKSASRANTGRVRKWTLGEIYSASMLPTACHIQGHFWPEYKLFGGDGGDESGQGWISWADSCTCRAHAVNHHIICQGTFAFTWAVY